MCIWIMTQVTGNTNVIFGDVVMTLSDICI